MFKSAARLVCLIIIVYGFCDPLHALQEPDSSVHSILTSGVPVDQYAPSDDDRYLLLIEDAHADYTAQRELSRIIGSLRASTGTHTIAVEGSTGDISTLLFASFPYDAIRKSMADNFLKKSFISGEEYFSIYTGEPLTLTGVDDVLLYQQNCGALQAVYKQFNACEEIFEQVKVDINSLKKQVYNDDLYAFDTSVKQYVEGGLSPEVYLTDCLRISDARAQKYDLIDRFLRLLQRDASFDYDALETEVHTLCLYIDTYCAPYFHEEISAVYADDLIDRDEFSLRILAIARQCLPDQPEKYRYLRAHENMITQFAALSLNELDRQIADLTNECYSVLVRSQQEQAVFSLDQQCDLICRTASLNLTRCEYEAVQSGLFLSDASGLFNALAASGDEYDFTDAHREKIAALLHTAMEFYRIVCLRDNVLINNTFSLFETTGAKSVIMVVGGFHTDAILKECQKQGIGYVVIRPGSKGGFDFDRYVASVLRKDMRHAHAATAVATGTLRAASFFASRSFDDRLAIQEFRNRLIFGSIFNALDNFSHIELHSVVTRWRGVYERAARMNYGNDHTKFVYAMDHFDQLVTSRFLEGNIEMDSDNRRIVVNTGLETIEAVQSIEGDIIVRRLLSAQPEGNILEPVALDDHPLVLSSTQVYVTIPVISDDIDSQRWSYVVAGHIQALNKRGVRPVIIVPYQADHRQRMMQWYRELFGNDYQVAFAVYDNIDTQALVSVNEYGEPLTLMPPVSQTRSAIIQFAFDRQRADEQAEVLCNMFYAEYRQDPEHNSLEPCILRIPLEFDALVGEGLPASIITVSPFASQHHNALHEGIAADSELLDVIAAVNQMDREGARIDFLAALENELGQNIEVIWNTLNVMEGVERYNLHWTVRHVDHPYDNELAVFMRAAMSHPKPQIIFTFYDTSSSAMEPQMRFLQKHAVFVDLTNGDNTVFHAHGSVVVVNLPALSSKLFRKLLAVSDGAVVDSLPVLSDALAINKLSSAGLPVLFSASEESHRSVVTGFFQNNVYRDFAGNVKEYAAIVDTPGVDYLSDWEPVKKLDSQALIAQNMLFHYYVSQSYVFQLGKACVPVNMLNTLTTLMEKVDQGVLGDTLTEIYGGALNKAAEQLVQQYFLNDDLDISDMSMQHDFIDTMFIPYLKNYVRAQLEYGIPAELVPQRAGAIAQLLLTYYSMQLQKLHINQLHDFMAGMYDALSNVIASIAPLPGGGVMMYAGGERYACFAVRSNPFNPDEASQSAGEVQVRYVDESVKDEYIRRAEDIAHIKRMLDMPLGIDFDAICAAGVIATYSATDAQINQLKADVAMLLVDEFRNLAARYHDVIESTTGAASPLAGLYALLERKERNALDPELTAALNIDIKTVFEQAVTGSDTIHYPMERDWIEPFQRFLDDIIIQKVAAGDLSLHFGIILPAYAAQAYSVAAVIDDALRRYAQAYLFADIPPDDREQRTLQWIDSWDIALYAVDNDIRPLLALQEGVYQLSGAGTCSGFAFDGAFPQPEDIFSAHIPAAADQSSIVQVNPQYKNWVRPILLDIAQPKPFEHLHQLNLDGALFMRVVPMTGMRIDDISDYQRNCYDMLNRLFHPDYKSFLYSVYLYQESNSYGEPLPLFSDIVGVDSIEGQTFVVPPHNCPSIGTALSISQHTGRDDPDSLIAFLGLSVEQSAVVRGMFSRYHHTVDEIVEAVSFDFDSFTAITHDALYELISLVIHDSALEGDVRAQISYALQHVYEDVTAKLAVQSERGVVSAEAAQQSAQLLKNSIDAFVDSIDFIPQRHLFISVNDHEHEHFYREANVFHPLVSQRGIPQLITERLDTPARNALLHTIENADIVEQILREFSDIDFADLFRRWQKPDFDAGSTFNGIGFVPFYTGSSQQIDALITHISMISLPLFEDVITHHAATIDALTDAPATLGALRDILKRIKTEGINSDDPDVLQLQNACADVVAAIQHYTDSGFTAFFRANTDWLDDLNLFLDRLIAQKVSRNDYTLTASSLGASYGKEAYTIAVVIDTALRRYARSHVDISSDEYLLNRWVEQWDVVINVFERDIQKLVTARQGVYRIHGSEMELLQRPDMQEQYGALFSAISDVSLTDDIDDPEQPIFWHQYVAVNPRYKAWMRLISMDFSTETGIALFEQTTNDIVFALNILPFFSPFGEWRSFTDEHLAQLRKAQLTDAMFDSALADGYPSFVLFNSEFNQNPVSLDILPDQQYVVPPKQLPGSATVLAFSHTHSLKKVDDITRCFGVQHDAAVVVYEQHLRDTEFIEELRHIPLSIGEFTDWIKPLLHELVRDTVLGYTRLELDKSGIMTLLDSALAAASGAFTNQLDTLRLEDVVNTEFLESAQTYFSEFVRDIRTNLSITDDGYLFVSVGADDYSYSYLDYRWFSSVSEHVGVPERITSVLPARIAAECMDRLRDRNAAKRLLDCMLPDTRDYFRAFIVPQHLAGYRMTQEQNEMLRFYLAALLVPDLERIAAKHLSLLGVNAHIEPIMLLADYFQHIIADDQKPDPLITGEILDLLQGMRNEPVAQEQMVFFRNAEQWQPGLQGVIASLIRQKVADGDFSFTIRSIGGAQGRDAYSVAALLERELDKYARNIVCCDISDEDEQHQAVSRWIDRWDVHVYAIDDRYRSLIIAQQGNYELEADEIAFFEAHPDLKQMFSEWVSDARFNRATVTVNSRLKRWLRPIRADIYSYMQMLTDIPAEITIAMDVFADRVNGEKLFGQIRDSVNMHYLSYTIFTEDLWYLEGQSYLLPPSQLDVAQLDRYVQSEGFESLTELQTELGFSDVPSPFVNIYWELRDTAAQYIHDFYEQYELDFAVNAGHELFINEILTPGMISLIMDWIRQNVPPSEITARVQVFRQLLTLYYTRQLDSTAVSQQQISAVFSSALERLLMLVHITDNGHLFMPVTVDGTQLFINAYLDWSSQDATDAASVISYPVTPADKERLVMENSDMEYAVLLLSWRDISDVYRAIRRSGAVLPDDLDDNPSVQRMTNEHIARTIFEDLRTVARKYAARIGAPTIRALYEYTQQIDRNTLGDDSDVLHAIHAVLRALDYTAEAGEQSKTSFFDNAQAWRLPLERVVADIITQKILRNDFSLVVKTASAGGAKEAVSLGAVVYKQLYDYAYNTIYTTGNADTRTQRAGQWVERWSVRIYVLESQALHFYPFFSGLFVLEHDEYAYVSSDQEYRDILFDRIYPSVADRSVHIGHVSPLISRWIRPVHVDSVEPETLLAYPSEITFATLTSDMLPALHMSGNSQYKHCVYLSHQQPIVLPPQTLPARSFVYRFAMSHNITDSSALSAVFGIPENIFRDHYDMAMFNDSHGALVALFEKELSERQLHQGVLQLLYSAAADLVSGLLIEHADHEKIRSSVSGLGIHWSYMYNALLTMSGKKPDDIRSNVKILADGICIAPDSTVFIPAADGMYTEVSLNTPYLESFFDSVCDSILKHFYGIQSEIPAAPSRAQTMVRTVTASEMADHLKLSAERALMCDIITRYIDLQESFAFVPFELLPLDFIDERRLSILSGVHKSPQFGIASAELTEALRYRLAQVSHAFFRVQAQSYAEYTGNNDINALYDYSVQQGPDNEQVHELLKKFAFALHNARHETVITRFFRDSIYWLPELESYLELLIIQKVANGDFSISLKSVGSSIGKEAFSFAAVIDNALCKYAREQLYKYVADQEEQERLVAGWVDRWNVNIYTFDNSFQRLLAGTEGIYLIGKNEYSFFDAHPTYKNMFSLMSRPDPQQQVWFVRISDRLKRWIIPVYCDLSKNPELITEYPAEIIIAMNILSYLKGSSNRAPITRAVTEAGASQYPSFLMYNMAFHDAPVAHGPFGAHPFTAPASHALPAHVVYRLIGRYGLISTEQISDFFCAEPQILERDYAVSLLPQARTIVDKVASQLSGTNNVYATYSEILNGPVRQTIVFSVFGDLERGADEHEVMKRVRLFEQQLKFFAAIRLKPLAAASFCARLEQYISGIEITGGAHLFVPDLKRASMYMHFYLEGYYFHPLDRLRGRKKLQEQLIPASLKERTQALIEDTLQVRAIIEHTLDLPTVFSDWFQTGFIIPLYEGSAEQIDELTRLTARMLVGHFRRFIELHSATLQSMGIDSLASLREYIVTHDIESEPVGSIIKGTIRFIERRISDSHIYEQKHIRSYGSLTYFFRDSHHWRKSFEQYIEEVIPQKVAKGDLTFTMKSVGSSTGKEAYALGAVLAHALEKYASQTLYADIENRFEREQRIADWIDSWDIRILAYDLVLQRHAPLLLGSYVIDRDELQFFEQHPEYQFMFTGMQAQPGKNSFIVQINDRLQRWVNSVFVNLDTIPEVAGILQSEVTFAMNSLPYIRQRDGVLKAIRGSFNPDYKSFFLFNYQTFGAPAGHGTIAEQEFVIPARNLPDTDTVVNVALALNIFSSDRLGRIFGVPGWQIDILFNRDIGHAPEERALEQYRHTRDLIDRML